MTSRVASAQLDALAGLFQTAEKEPTGSGTMDHYPEVCQEIFEGKKENKQLLNTEKFHK